MTSEGSYRVVVPAQAVAKGRARFQKNGRAFTPAKTVAAEAWVRLCCVDQVGTPRVPGPVAVRIVYVMPIPKSMTKALQAQARANALMPTRKPDWDNLAKLTSDALNGIAWRDDAEVASAQAWKVYGAEPCTVLAWWTLTPEAAQAEVARAWAEVGGPGLARGGYGRVQAALAASLL